MRRSTVQRIWVLLGGLVLVAVVLVVRLYMVQVVRGDEFSSRADRQYVQPQEGVFDRGSIYFEDKNGVRISAATLESGYVLAINPSVISDPAAVLAALEEHVALDEAVFMAAAEKTDDPYEVVARRITHADARTLADLGITGVILSGEKWRSYPGDTLAAHALGFVAFREDELAGRYGVERYYDDVLSRKDDDVYVNFFAEMFGNLTEVFVVGAERREGDLILTIEPSVEGFLEEELADVQSTWGARETGGVIIDPMTGEIYALGVNPTFDLNDFQGITNPARFGNPIVEGVFEMGSVMKPLTIAAGLDAGVITRETTYEDKGYATYNNRTIANYDGEARGVVNMQEVLNQSLNTGVAFIMERLGTKRFADYLLEFGIGEETGIDLPGEVPGLVANLSSPREIEYATASFGQGIAVTPIEAVRAFSALANGGKLITPHVVKQIDSEFGLSKKIFYPAEGQVIQPETSEEITRMLVEVVDDALLDGTVKIPTHSIAAKTGTAQIAAPGGGYYDDRYLHAFFGYFPAHDPRFLVFLYTREPMGVRYASQTLTEPFMNIVKFLISYYEVPPDRGVVLNEE